VDSLRMIEQIDENTWRGTASGYQHDLYYHVRKIENDFFSLLNGTAVLSTTNTSRFTLSFFLPAI